MEGMRGGDIDPSVFATSREIIAEARKGRMFILVDHEDRENEGDLVIPAAWATAEAINFMATHARGLICLALEGQRVDGLALPMMAVRNSSRYETAFTVSIEAREGVGTGISVADRARTIAVAIDPASGPADLATPGHVFPLRAKDGGVLVRAGHTEAAVDVARLAGLTPAGVICEIMKADGTMARMPDLVAFAELHDLKIGTIADLIEYRRRHEHLVSETAADVIRSSIGGEWTVRIFEDAPDRAEHIAIIKGRVEEGTPTLVRMHVVDPFEDLLALNPGRWNQVADSMTAIAAEGRGVIVLLRDTSPSMIANKLRGVSGAPKELRQHGIGAQILGAIGVSEIVLLTNSPLPKVVGLERYGVRIVGTRRIEPSRLDAYL
jgi:3,4-dihydroxy 2-butanone 4-phosphate synthase/GTP cyclohydrolase II